MFARKFVKWIQFANWKRISRTVQAISRTGLFAVRTYEGVSTGRRREGKPYYDRLCRLSVWDKKKWSCKKACYMDEDGKEAEGLLAVFIPLPWPSGRMKRDVKQHTEEGAMLHHVFSPSPLSSSRTRSLASCSLPSLPLHRFLLPSSSAIVPRLTHAHPPTRRDKQCRLSLLLLECRRLSLLVLAHTCTHIYERTNTHI